MSYHDEVILGKTKNNKKIAYRVREGEALYSIYFVGGGAIPPEFEGMWTDVRQIEVQVSNYLNREKLCAPDQHKKDLKTNLRESKKRPSRLKQKVVA